MRGLEKTTTWDLEAAIEVSKARRGSKLMNKILDILPVGLFSK
jgi:hypothetical protein